MLFVIVLIEYKGTVFLFIFIHSQMCKLSLILYQQMMEDLISVMYCFGFGFSINMYMEISESK